jgi:osmotically-inducible protein OsmY
VVLDQQLIPRNPAINNQRCLPHGKGAWLTAITTIILIFSISYTAEAHNETINDTSILEAVENRLRKDASVSFQKINVEVRQGIVTLSGSIADLLAKERAVRLVETVKGVTAVIDMLALKAPSVADKHVSRDIKYALRDYPGVESDDIQVQVRNGEVNLSGQAESWARRRMIARIVKGVKGVQTIKNKIRVSYHTKRADAEIAQDIKAVLDSDIYINAAMITVDVQNGKVALSGIVGSAAEKRRARTNAYVAGVIDVNIDDLEVQWQKSNAMRKNKATLSRPDTLIKKNIEKAIFYDPRINSAKLDIAVKNGSVTLKGVVDSYAARRAAEQDAWNTLGVRQVVNRLEIRYKLWPLDGEIKKQIKDVFDRDVLLSQSDIEFKVNDHKVLLYGSAQSDIKKIHAENVVAQIGGVLSIQNRIHVDRPRLNGRDAAIQENVISELFWSPFVDNEDIQVSVDNGEVTLHGFTSNRFESDVAIHNAFEAGATSVRTQFQMPGDLTDFRYYPDRDNFFAYNSQLGNPFWRP